MNNYQCIAMPIQCNAKTNKGDQLKCHQQRSNYIHASNEKLTSLLYNIMRNVALLYLLKARQI